MSAVKRRKLLEEAGANASTAEWSKGSLHLVLAAPLQAGAFRMKITPPAPNGGPHLVMTLAWIGNVVFYHHALQKTLSALNDSGGIRNDRQVAGIVNALVQSEPAEFNDELSSKEENVFWGKLTGDKVREMLKSRVPRVHNLSEDQWKVLEQMNTTRKPVIAVRALAGAGKSLLMGLCIQQVVPELEHDEGILIIQPSKSNRDDSVQNLLGIIPKGTKLHDTIFWLGREMEGGMKSWHKMLEESINEALKDDRDHLEAITREMRGIYGEFRPLQLDWRRCLNREYVTRQEVWEALGKFHSQAVAHMKQLFFMVQKRNFIIEEKLRDI